jgi:serine/threonine-protein kinase
VASTPAPDLHASWPGADPGVVRVLERAMARAPEDRHHRAGELAAELAAALERSAHPAPPTAATRPVAATSTAGSRRFGKRAMGAALAAALAVVAVVVFAMGGGDDGSDPRPAGETQAKTTPRKEQPERTETQAQAPATTPQPETPQTTPTTPQQTQPVSGDAAKLNQQGYALLRRGDAAGAIPILQKAVDAYPESSKDLTYGYALFNLGSALRQAGRPAEAIPILERRLAIPNQTKTVQEELKKARKEAGKG